MQWAVGKVLLHAPQNTCKTVTEDTLLEPNTAEEIKSANKS